MGAGATRHRADSYRTGLYRTGLYRTDPATLSRGGAMLSRGGG
jgi:hypothetical protein